MRLELTEAATPFPGLVASTSFHEAQSLNGNVSGFIAARKAIDSANAKVMRVGSLHTRDPAVNEQQYSQLTSVLFLCKKAGYTKFSATDVCSSLTVQESATYTPTVAAP